MKRIWSLLLAVLLIFNICMAPVMGAEAEESGDDGISETPGWPSGPEIQGDGAIVVEATTGSILYAKNIYDQFYPASTTKILTTLVALENSNLDDVLTVSYAADNYVSKTSSRMGLVEGEQITMEQALYGIMLESANEATYAVGEYVGGSIARFIKMMNAKATALGCTHSHFANSHGLHDTDHYTCPYDMMLIAKAAYKNEEFMKITGTATYAMPATNKNEAKLLTNHHWFINKTMKYDYCIGGKTGATTQAGYALVTYARKDGMTLISVVMHAPTWNAVYTDTKTLLDYCFDNFTQYDMSELGREESDFPELFSGDSELSLFDEGRSDILYSGSGGIIILPSAIPLSDTTKSISWDYDTEIGQGENIIGKVEYTYAGRTVGSADIVYYNSRDTMTESRFKSEWPSYMIPLDVAFTEEELAGSSSGQSSQGADNDSSQPDAESLPLYIGLGIGLTVLLLGSLIAVIGRRKRY